MRGWNCRGAWRAVVAGAPRDSLPVAVVVVQEGPGGCARYGVRYFGPANEAVELWPGPVDAAAERFVKLLAELVEKLWRQTVDGSQSRE